MIRRVAERAMALPTASVWDTFTPLANAHNAVNLGQGFPTHAPPTLILDAARSALDRQVCQYTRAAGHLRLVNALKQMMEPAMPDVPLDALRNVVVTVGATEALYLAAMATLNEGDHCLLVQPFYDSYLEQVRLARGVPHCVALQRGAPADSSAAWTLPWADMEAVAQSHRIKLMFFNNPANVPGKVFSRAELERLAAFAVQHDIIVIADEVYDVLTYDDNRLIRLASLPGMADRTVTIGSAGKLFSVTGFKVGWAIGPADIIAAMARIHQYVPFCVSSTMQEAVAAAIEGMPAANYLPTMRAQYDAKRHQLVDMLKRVHLRPIVPQGSYFVVADASHIDPKRYIDPASTDAPDWQFCKWLIVKGGVCAIPVSPFYHHSTKPPGVLARFAFCKTSEQINEAGERLARLNLDS